MIAGPSFPWSRRNTRFPIATVLAIMKSPLVLDTLSRAVTPYELLELLQGPTALWGLGGRLERDEKRFHRWLQPSEDSRIITASTVAQSSSGVLLNSSPIRHQNWAVLRLFRFFENPEKQGS